MSINITNYELYVMDYLEGNLESLKKKEMETFLLLHPNIAHEIEGLNKIKITDRNTRKLDLDFSLSLKKNEVIELEQISEENYEEVFIADLEQDLSIQEQQKLALFLKENPGLQPEFKQQQSTILQPNKNIVFKNKALLKKKNRLVVLWPSIATVAAILFLSFWLFKPQEINRSPVLLSKIDNKTINRINFTPTVIQLQTNRRLTASFTPDVLEKTEARAVIKINKLSPIPCQQIAINGNDWEKEMVLMQSFAFHRNQLYVVNEYPQEKRKSVVSMISSLLWKTTKGQIRNMKDNIVNENYKFLQANNIKDITGGFIAVRPIGKE